MTDRQLIQDAAQLFDSLEKWNALFEIHDHTDAIMTAWLTMGAEGLRKDFHERSSTGWTCEPWEAKNETIWFLTDLGRDSIGLVLAWPHWEFHLIFKTPAALDDSEARRLLKEDVFQPLVARFDPEEAPAKGGNYRSLACDTKFNPFGGSSERTARRRELAWYAAHDSDRFVKLMSDHVRLITDDSTLTALVRDLNYRAKRLTG